jgi:hypothetical protein
VFWRLKRLEKGKLLFVRRQNFIDEDLALAGGQGGQFRACRSCLSLILILILLFVASGPKRVAHLRASHDKDFTLLVAFKYNIYSVFSWFSSGSINCVIF